MFIDAVVVVVVGGVNADVCDGSSKRAVIDVVVVEAIVGGGGVADGGIVDELIDVLFGILPMKSSAGY